MQPRRVQLSVQDELRLLADHVHHFLCHCHQPINNCHQPINYCHLETYYNTEDYRCQCHQIVNTANNDTDHHHQLITYNLWFWSRAIIAITAAYILATSDIDPKQNKSNVDCHLRYHHQRILQSLSICGNSISLPGVYNYLVIDIYLHFW